VPFTRRFWQYNEKNKRDSTGKQGDEQQLKRFHMVAAQRM